MIQRLEIPARVVHAVLKLLCWRSPRWVPPLCCAFDDGDGLLDGAEHGGGGIVLGGGINVDGDGGVGGGGCGHGDDNGDGGVGRGGR